LLSEASLEHLGAHSANLTGRNGDGSVSTITLRPHGGIHANDAVEAGRSVVVVELNAVDGGGESSLLARLRQVTMGGTSLLHVLSEEDLHTSKFTKGVLTSGQSNGSNSILLAHTEEAVLGRSVEVLTHLHPVDNGVASGTLGGVIDDGVISAGRDSGSNVGASGLVGGGVVK